MNAWLDTPNVRIALQVAICAGLGAVALVILIFDAVAIAAQASLVNGLLDFAMDFMGVLALPIQTAYAPVLVSLTGVLPVIAARVLYQLDANGAPTQDLDRGGKVAIGILAAGALLGFLALGLMLVPDKINELTPGANSKSLESLNAIKGLLTSIITFKTAYLVQLLGLKQK